MIPPVPNVPMDEEHMYMWMEFFEAVRFYCAELSNRISALGG